MNKKLSCFCTVVLVIAIMTRLYAQTFDYDNFVDYNLLDSTHDMLSLSEWGPYSKKYIGISNIPDMDQGIRFDLSVFAGFYRHKVNIPNVLFPSGFYPWRASTDLTFFEFRHELEWKDQVYSDISFSKMNNSEFVIRAHMVNNTNRPQNLVLHLLGFLNYPDEWLTRVMLPEGAIWKEAIAYKEIFKAIKEPRDDLPYDGKINGEIRGDEWVGGSALFFKGNKESGNRIVYQLNILDSFENAVLVLRYKSEGEISVQSENLVKLDFRLSETRGEVVTQTIQLGQLPVGQQEIVFNLKSDQAFTLDGFGLLEHVKREQLAFKKPTENSVPEIIDGPVTNSIILKYAHLDNYYGLVWEKSDHVVREFITDDFDSYFKENLMEHVRKKFVDDGSQHYSDVFIRPVTLKAHETKTIYSAICKGSLAHVNEAIRCFDKTKAEEAYREASSHSIELPKSLNSGQYAFSQQLMVATLSTNVVFPIYTQNEYIKHRPPGRRWNSLYTWDSGFIGLGLAEYDLKGAIESLNTYTNGENEQAPFIHHGSLVPVQFYLLQELWNRTQSKDLLEYFYPRLKRYYMFFSGQYGSSTTNPFLTNLLQPWDYFYNSGGWDDYPAQWYLRSNSSIREHIAPAITTSHAIRIAKIMKQAALTLGKKEDVILYEKDITRFTQAIQKNLWDPKAGYFSYAVHDTEGNFKEIFKNSEGFNFNLGMDGVQPLVAGICTTDQKEVLMNKLFDPVHLWTNVGLSVVDQSAPYYQKSGYWNGAVWMPHQWFIWKTMLDQGEADRAWQIAKTGLDVWKKEVDASYSCFEHFLIETGRGAGWHQFGGLSTPVLSWYGAYYVPGRITVGFDGWIEKQVFNESKTKLTAHLSFLPNSSADSATVIVTMAQNDNYKVRWNNAVLDYKILHNGTISIQIPFTDNKSGLLIIDSQ